MVARRVIASDAQYRRQVPNSDGLTFGMVQNVSKEVDTANLLASKTITARRTYLTGTVGLLLAITLPDGNAANDGMILTITSTTTRVLVTWNTPGATIVAGIAGPLANVPITLQYDDSTKVWVKLFG